MPKPNYKEERGAWRNMIHRCHHTNHRDYHNYGQRGIQVCDAWRSKDTGFRDFLDHIGPRPEAGYSLERIDNERGYEPGNVKWATRSEQNANRRRRGHRQGNLVITINGRSQTTGGWSRETGVDPAVIYKRLQDGRTGEDLIHNGRLPRRPNTRSSRSNDLYL